jgi:hypothetical protein
MPNQLQQQPQVEALVASMSSIKPAHSMPMQQLLVEALVEGPSPAHSMPMQQLLVEALEEGPSLCWSGSGRPPEQSPSTEPPWMAGT